MRIGLSSRTIEQQAITGHIDGIGIYTQNLLRCYQQLGLDVAPIFYPFWKNRHAEPSLSHSLKSSLPYSASFFLSLLSPFNLNSNIENNISLYHATDYHVPKFKKIPVITTLHDPIMLKHPEWGNRRLRRLKNWALKTSARFADAYITLSHAMVPELVEYWGIKEHQIEVIHNGVSEWWFETVSEEEKKQTLAKYNLGTGYILYVGTLQPRKNVERIIEAYQQLPSHIQQHNKLVIIGKNGWRTEHLIAQIEKLVSEQKALWLNKVPTNELRTLYQCAQLFVFPSLYEGFGLPILEAFASNIPVITSNITSLPEVAGNAAYLIDPYDSAEMSYAMQRILTDSNLREHYIQTGAQRAKQFSWFNCAQKTLDVYKKFL